MTNNRDKQADKQPCKRTSYRQMDEQTNKIVQLGIKRVQMTRRQTDRQVNECQMKE